ncbi:WD repeat-containing protein 74 [Culicoides brevitarsis]|uniref:WD repeat-containing protein 74 n=1 Tax=Culicoides brevitarsis TaxID=469753 RepID=UPI00307B59EA
MSFTTANKKSNEYTEEHILYVGTHTGSFKRLDISQENPFREHQIEKVEKLEKNNGITSLSWSNPKEKSEILVGREDGVVKVFDFVKLQHSWKLEGKVMGLGKFDGKIIAAVDNGDVHLLSENAAKPVETLQLSGDNISRLRQCLDDPNLIATGGKERKNNLKVIDLTAKKVVFTTKNLPNDELDLEVPVWDTDFAFLTPNVLGTCSRHGYVRVYDSKQQRRPVFNYKNDKEQISYVSMAAHGDLIFVGANLGVVRAFDRRSMKHAVHTYKGFVGSVTSLALDTKGKYLVAGCLDRYVRVFDVESPSALFQCYVKSKVTQVLLQDIKGEAMDGTEEAIKLKERNRIENDPEYEALFNNMQTVEEENNEEEAIPTKTKRKNQEAAQVKSKKKKGKAV